MTRSLRTIGVLALLLGACASDGANEGASPTATTVTPTAGSSAPSTSTTVATTPVTVATTTATSIATTIGTPTTASAGEETTVATDSPGSPAPTLAATTTSSPACDPSVREDPSFPLHRCDTGWGVVAVRTALVARGLISQDDETPFVFTDDLEDAVRRFQQANGLVVDGLVGRDTWFALHPEYLDVDHDLVVFDTDGDIGPAEVASLGDANLPE